MKIYREKDYESMSRRAAQIMAAQIVQRPDCVLGLATGSTPVGMYQKLIEWNRAGIISFKEVRTINLDEYRGLSPEHDQSYRHFMQKHLFDHTDIVPENTWLPDGLSDDPDEECVLYDACIRSLGGIDLQLLGIGHNGHIGFNEPGDVFIRPTHVVDLSERTIDANSRFFAARDEVPRQAYTVGIGPIMAARRILLTASGEGKAEALYNALCGPITPRCPGSIIQLHPDVVVVADEGALNKLIAEGVAE